MSVHEDCYTQYAYADVPLAKQNGYGLVESLKIGKFTFPKNHSVKDPKKRSEDLSVVGPIRLVSWPYSELMTKKRAPITLQFLLEPASKEKADELIQNPGDLIDAEVEVAWTTYKVDSNNKVFKRCHPNKKNGVKARLYQQGAFLGFKILSPEPEEVLPGSYAYLAELQLVPPEGMEQAINVNSAEGGNNVEPWGEASKK
jgi:hypothetical protein